MRPGHCHLLVEPAFQLGQNAVVMPALQSCTMYLLGAEEPRCRTGCPCPGVPRQAPPLARVPRMQPPVCQRLPPQGCGAPPAVSLSPATDLQLQAAPAPRGCPQLCRAALPGTEGRGHQHARAVAHKPLKCPACELLLPGSDAGKQPRGIACTAIPRGLAVQTPPLAKGPSQKLPLAGPSLRECHPSAPAARAIRQHGPEALCLQLGCLGDTCPPPCRARQQPGCKCQRQHQPSAVSGSEPSHGISSTQAPL
mmetsp:Transcript_5258/g.16392  ORF Transcript_5258/g.16392 Transcript_5258/m.16392 type:complete len:252 (+) Transcript_5258:458-1213(+)